MCGRYTLIRLADFTDMFPWIRMPDDPPRDRYNIAPSQDVAVVTNEGRNQVEFVRWGLVPSWAKDVAIGNRMINARMETLAEKPAYRTALKRRRCIIPATGFYEWKKHPDGKTKTPMYLRMKNGKPFAFAGLWETWHSDDGSELRTCVIITGPPNELLEPIHDRMPVILDPKNYKNWLDSSELTSDKLLSLLTKYPAAQMQAVEVSRAVNSPKNDTPNCIEPVKNDPPTLFG